MSEADVRVPGFWNSVNNASSNRTMITQRAKFRRFAFIPGPWYGRATRPAVGLFVNRGIAASRRETR